MQFLLILLIFIHIFNILSQKSLLNVLNIYRLIGVRYAKKKKIESLASSKDDKQSDKFIPSNKNNKKENLKKHLLRAAGIAVFTGIALAVANPKLLRKVSNNVLPFDNAKLFDTPIDLNKYYQTMLDSLKGIKVNLAFDEKTVTDKELGEFLNNFGISIFSTDKQVAAVRKNPNLMYALNAFSGIDSDKISGTYGVWSRIDQNITTDEVDTIVRFINKAAKPHSYCDLQDFVEHHKDLMSLSALMQDVLNKSGLDTSNSQYLMKFRTQPVEGTNNSIDEFIKYIESLKMGTIKNSSSYEVYNLFYGYDIPEDFKMARRLYEGLNGDVLEKLSITNITELLNIKDMSSLEVSQTLNNMPKEALKKLSGRDFSTYVKFSDFYGIENINQLSIDKKRKLLRRLVSENSSIFSSGKSIAKVLPKNQQEYCRLMDKLAKSIGVDTKKLTPAQLADFNKVIEDISHSIRKVDLNSATFELDFSRKDFIAAVEKKLAKLSPNEKMEVMDYFGFELKDGKFSTCRFAVRNKNI